MSRRSSCSSGASSIPSSISTRDDDPLLRDCFELRKRLQETERSLNSLQPQHNKPKSPGINHLSPRSNNGDLSPDVRFNVPSTTPDNVPVRSHVLCGEPIAANSTPRRPFTKPYCSESEISMNQDAVDPKIDSVPDNEIHSSMWKKLLSLRDENSQLFAQNNRLMSELENNCFQLHELKSKLQDANSNAFNAQKKSLAITTQMDSLRTSYSNAQNVIREKDGYIDDLVQELDDFKKEAGLANENVKDLKSFNEEIKEELHRTKKELDDAAHDLKVMQQQQNDQLLLVDEIKAEMGSEIEKLCGQLDEMATEREEFLETLNHEQKKIIDYQRQERALKEEVSNNETLIKKQSDQITSLSTTVSRQTEALSQLRSKLETTKHGSSADNLLLKQTIEEQQERIHDYQTEVEMTKAHVSRLEALVHELHEQTISDRLASFAINNPNNNSDEFIFGLSQSPRAKLANLNLKLATKDAEIQKLQALLTSQSASTQQEMAGLFGDRKEGTDGLRSDLSAVIEKCRSSDSKRQELEQMIGRCEDEASRASSQISELENRLANKMAQISSLEHKFNNKSAQLVEMQHEVDKKDEEIVSLESKLRSKSSELTSFERRERDWKDQLIEIQECLNARDNELNQLKSLIANKDDDLKDRAASLLRIKELHVEQCDEMTIQIEKLQLQGEEKDATINESKKVNHDLQLQIKAQEVQLTKNKKEFEEMKTDLQQKEAQAHAHEEKLTLLEHQTVEGTNRVASLKEALSDCQKELAEFILKFENEKNNYESILIEKNEKLRDQESMLEELKTDESRRSFVVRELKDALLDRQAMLTESQQRISELETSQQKLENELQTEKENFIKSRANFEIDLNRLKTLLKEASAELEQRTAQIQEQDNVLQNLTTDCKHLRENEIKSKAMLDDTQQMVAKKETELLKLKEENEVNKELVIELKLENDTLKSTVSSKEEDTNLLNLKFTDEVGSVQTELKATIDKLSELEKILLMKTEELQEKDSKLHRLDQLLSDSQEEARENDLRLEQMHKQLRDSQMELRQRATQIAQMEMSHKEQHSELSQKVATLEEELNQTQNRLSHVTAEASGVESKLESKTKSLTEQESLVETLEMSLNKQDKLLDESTQQLKQLHAENEAMRSELREFGFVKQELTATMTKVQAMHDEYQQLRKQCQLSQRNEEELSRELDDLHTLLAAKETDCHRLARELGASQVREGQLEVKHQEETRNLQHQYSMKCKQLENELEKSHDQQNDDEASHQKEILGLKMTITSLKDDIKLRESDCLRSESRVAELEQQIKTLTTEFQLQRKRTHELNESLVIKQSEAARLEAKLSGYERATSNYNRQKKHVTKSPPSFQQFSLPLPRPSSASGRYEFNLINDQKVYSDNSFNKSIGKESSIPLLKKGLHPRQRSNSVTNVSSLESVEGLLKRAALELDRQVSDSDTLSNSEISLSFLGNAAVS